jgi:phage-related protein
MLDNLKLGYGGTKTEMQRLLADAEKLSGQKYDISNLSDVYEAIHVVQKEMGITGTTAKEAASTLSGSFASMKAAASNFLGDLALGRNVGPAMKGLVESASTFLFDNLLPAIGRIFKSLPTAIATFIKTGIPQLLSAGAKMVESLVAGMKKAAPNIASNLPKMVSQAFDWLESTRERLRKLEKRSVSLEDKMQEIRLVNRAKWLLITQKGMTEEQAHKAIEKLAMDSCITKSAVAEQIIGLSDNGTA